MRRRSRIILILIVFNFIFTAVGFYAKMRLSYWGLLAHATYTVSVIGAFYVYILIDFALDKDSSPAGGESEQGTKSMGQTVIMLITSLPMLSLFIMGLFSLYLAVQIEKELDSRKVAENGGEDAEKNQRE